MLSLIIKKKYNILINTNTGKWLGFLFNSKEKNKIIDNISKEQLKEIYKNYNKQDELLALYVDIDKQIPFKNDLLDKMNYVILHTSDACNMNCLYCYAKDNLNDTKTKIMTYETMIKTIDSFYIKDEDFYVLFHGREPLTNYKNIIKTVRNYKDNKFIKFILQTNGLLLTEEKIKELSKLNVSISISFDGLDNNSNKLRINKTTLNYTKYIKNLLKKHPELSAILIVHKNNINKLNKITKYLMNNNQDSAAYNFLWPTQENPYLTKYVVDNKKLLKKMKRLFKNSIKTTKESSDFIFKERDLYLLYGRVVYRHINNYMCSKSPCGAGKNCVSVDYNGDVYACTTVNGQQENLMGNIYSNTKQEILSADYILKHRDINKIQDCANCPIRIFCGGGACSGLLYNYKKEINIKSIYCYYYQNMILFLMENMIKLSKHDIFINY